MAQRTLLRCMSKHFARSLRRGDSVCNVMDFCLVAFGQAKSGPVADLRCRWRLRNFPHRTQAHASKEHGSFFRERT